MLAATAACAVAVSTGMAQDSSTSTTTTTGPAGVNATTTTSTSSGTGVISTYTPGSDYISFRTEADAAPVKYYYTKDTTLVDPEGHVVQWSALRPDMPVNYTYVRQGDRMVVTKVTLQKPISYYEKSSTTTTTTQP